MVVYYCTVLFITLFLQKTKLGFCTNFFTLCIVLLSDPIITYNLSQGNNLYESVIINEVFNIVLLLCTFTLHKNKTLLVIILLSLAVNLSYVLVGDMSYKILVFQNYKMVNIILFEMMVFNCVRTTKVYSWVVDDKKEHNYHNPILKVNSLC